jgi:hypothetical protein
VGEPVDVPAGVGVLGWAARDEEDAHGPGVPDEQAVRAAQSRSAAAADPMLGKAMTAS